MENINVQTIISKFMVKFLSTIFGLDKDQNGRIDALENGERLLIPYSLKELS